MEYVGIADASGLNTNAVERFFDLLEEDKFTGDVEVLWEAGKPVLIRVL